MLGRFLDPTNGFLFKRIFGSETNKDILINFLNDMLTFKESGPIVDVTFLRTVQDPEIFAQRTSDVDILCRDIVGNTCIVEMQATNERGIERRAQCYASSVYCSQTESKGGYGQIKEIIYLVVSGCVLFPGKKEFKLDNIVLDFGTCKNKIDNFSFTFLEFSKFTKDIDELENMVDKWTYLFKNAMRMSKVEYQKIIMDDPVMERVFDELDRFSLSEIDCQTYDQAEKYEGAYLASLAQAYDEGKAEGIAQRRREQAKELIRDRMEVRLIMKATGFSKEELEALHG